MLKSLLYSFCLVVFGVNSIVAQQKINLDELLTDKYNDYLATLENETLSLCCYQLFDLSNNINLSQFEKGIEQYDLEEKTETVEVYRKGESFVKQYFNRHPRVNKLDIVSGRIIEQSLITHSTLRLGMSKSIFLKMFFKESNTFEQIKKLQIWEDEEGLANTEYIFENGKLSEIRFNSEYDWIDKE